MSVGRAVGVTWACSVLAVAATLLPAGGGSTAAVAAPEPASVRSPFGMVDEVRSEDGHLVVSGWAIDPDRHRPIEVRFRVNGVRVARITADLARPDLAATYGRGRHHGFTARLPVGHGTHRVCAFMVNLGRGRHRELMCRRVNVEAGAAAGPRRPITINGTGDVRTVGSWYGYPPDYSRALGGLGGLFQEDDLTIVNLESAATSLGTPVRKNFNFRCSNAALNALRSSGVEVANQGNNHALDYGIAPMLDGVENIWRSGIAEVGAGVNLTDAYEPVLFDVGGWRIAVIGMAGFVEFGWNLATPRSPGLANGYEIGAMQAAVRDAAAGNDLVVVVIHWGWEGTTLPNQSQIERGRALIDAGADVVYGSHPHRLQPVERYREGVIFYSLGNFVWENLSFASSDTAVGQVIVRRNGTLRPCFLPANIRAHGHPTLDDPTVRSC